MRQVIQKMKDDQNRHAREAALELPSIKKSPGGKPEDFIIFPF